MAIVDTDIQSPGIHALFGIDEDNMQRTLNDYLWHRCTISEVAYEVTPDEIAKVNGSIYLIPCSIKVAEIARILKEGYSALLLSEGYRKLCEDFQLDYLFIDTHPGLNEETLLSVAISDALVIILRPDRQDFQGTAVTLRVARKLDTPKTCLVVNKVLPKFDPDSVREQVFQKFQTPVIGVFPVSEEMIELGSNTLFCLKYPQHPFTDEIKRVAAEITH